MANRYDEAPPLPRQPTALSVPAAMGTPASVEEVAQLPTDGHTLPPPPKFPSLTDVGLSSAQAAADAMGPSSAPALAPTADPPVGAPGTHRVHPSTRVPLDPALSSDAVMVGDAVVAAAGTDPAPQHPGQLALSSYTGATAVVSTATAIGRDAQGHTTRSTTTTTATTTTSAYASSRPLSAGVDNIEAALARASVTPGTGAKLAMEAGKPLWTSADQRELDRLLSEGSDVYVPPDVEERDLPSTPMAHYRPEPEEPEAPPSDGSIGARIAAWNRVVEHDPEPVATRNVFGVAPMPGMDESVVAEGMGDDDVQQRGRDARVSAVPIPMHLGRAEEEDLQQEGDVRGERQVAEGLDERDEASLTSSSTSVSSSSENMGAIAAATEEEPRSAVRDAAAPEEGATTGKNADVTRTIFGGTFLTVPVTSRSELEASAAGIGADGSDADPADLVEGNTEVMLRSESSAHINVTDDYGLKGGHMSGVNDAAFMGDGSLITCGDDGKVCIWDMNERVVDSEFVPYDGEPITMVYPMPDDEGSQSKTIMTLSKGRLMRIWIVDSRQAVLLRSSQIQASDKDLYMRVPIISKELKMRAASAAAAAAVTTTDAPEMPAQPSTDPPLASSEFMKTPVIESESTPDGVVEADAASSAAATAAAAVTGAPVVASVSEVSSPTAAETVEDAEDEEEEEEEEEQSKKYSLRKVLSFGRGGARKPVAG